MPGDTSIGWTDATWNPITGCVEVSSGCDNCYARTFAERWRGVPGHPYEQGFDLRLWPERLDQPIRWTKPRMIFVNSMSDLFQSGVPREFVAEVFAVMWLTRRHTYQVLTKRPKLMARMLGDEGFWNLVVDAAERRSRDAGMTMPLTRGGVMTLPNCWLGTSIESREYVGRADSLRVTPAAVQFISAEPLLGPLIPDMCEPTAGGLGSALSFCSWSDDLDAYGDKGLDLTGIDWLIIGGESGPGARPIDEQWVRDLLDAARETGTVPFVKQMGAVWAREHGVKDKAENPEEWPEDLRIQRWPTSADAPSQLAFDTDSVTMPDVPDVR